jgi:hypothetical protein
MQAVPTFLEDLATAYMAIAGNYNGRTLQTMG